MKRPVAKVNQLERELVEMITEKIWRKRLAMESNERRELVILVLVTSSKRLCKIVKDFVT